MKGPSRSRQPREALLALPAPTAVGQRQNRQAGPSEGEDTLEGKGRARCSGESDQIDAFRVTTMSNEQIHFETGEGKVRDNLGPGGKQSVGDLVGETITGDFGEGGRGVGDSGPFAHRSTCTAAIDDQADQHRRRPELADDLV